MAEPTLVVGLGNPEMRYARNRHNVGFMVVDRLAARCGEPPFREKARGVLARGDLHGRPVLLLKPQTFMNLSGESVQLALQFFKLSVKSLIVVHDELDVAFGSTRIKQGGGSAGHNGLKSITAHCGAEFVRVRVGIAQPGGRRGAEFVLADFDTDEYAGLQGVLDTAADACESIIRDGVTTAMNHVNVRRG